MPCRTDYMEPNAREAESKKVAGLLVYVSAALQKPLHYTVKNAAENYYGAIDNCDKYTAALCKLCGEMSDEQKSAIIYDGHNPKARELADWWERHQAVDKAREQQEAHDADVKAMAVAVGGVLSEEQKALLREAVSTGVL